MAAGPPNLQDVASRQGMQIKNGGITFSQNGWIKGGKTGYALGTGFFLGSSGGAYKFDIGSPTSYLRWTGTVLSLIGDITGISNIDITGTAKIHGAWTGGAGSTVSLELNSNKTALFGTYSYAGSGGVGVYGTAPTDGTGGYGVFGDGQGAGSVGVFGRAISGGGLGTASAGVVGTTDDATVPGVVASGYNQFGVGLALKVVGSSTFSQQITSTLAIGTAPLNVTSTTICPNLNADTVDGVHAASFATLTGSESLTNKTLTLPIFSYYTVATLPTAVGRAGARAGVTDALGPAFSAVVVGGGAVPVPVYSDGASWRCG